MMGDVNYEKLKKSLDRLKEQYENYQADKPTLTDLDKDGIKESVIKRFEVCNDTLWKHLKKYLQEKEKLVDLPNSPNGIFRKTYEASLIDEKTLENLIQYNSLRSMAAHDYDEIKAKKSLDQIENFIQDADILVKKLKGKKFTV